MMSMMMRRTLLPLFAAALLATVAGITATAGPVQGSGSLPAPDVDVMVYCAEKTPNPRNFLLARYGSVEGAEQYQRRVKWGQDGKFGDWRNVPKNPGKWRAVSVNRYPKPGETYVVQFRAIAEDQNAGRTGTGRYTYPVGSFTAPTGVEVTDAADDGAVRVTWHGGDDDGSGWFSVQHRTVGGKWKVAPWEQSPKTDDENSRYYRDFENLDDDRAYQFRVTEFTPSCEASPWSEVETLYRVPEMPAFKTSTGKAGDGHMMAIWITSNSAGADYHAITVGDSDPVKVTAKPASYRTPVELGTAYTVCVTAGNQRGESKAKCRRLTAEISSPIDSIRVRPDARIGGALKIRWMLIPTVNPTWHEDAPGSTHWPPRYFYAVREAGTGTDEWPNEETPLKELFIAGQKGGTIPTGLKGNTRYEVAVRSDYYGEEEWTRAYGRASMYAPQNVVVGFPTDDEGNTTDRITVGWEAPQDDGQTGYVANLRKGNGRKVNGARLDGDAVTTTFDGLKDGHWYYVSVRALGESGASSASELCFFQHGREGSQNTVSAFRTFDGDLRVRNSCAMTSE